MEPIEPPRKPARATVGKQAWRGARLVLIAGIVVAGALGVVVMLVPPLGPGQQPRTRCANNLRQLGALWEAQARRHPAASPAHDGPALLLWYRREGLVPRGRESVLQCPSDPSVPRETGAADSAAYDALDPGAPNSAVGRVSYAVRDFTRYPLEPDAAERQAVMCCAGTRAGPHHRRGVLVFYDDGAVKFRDHAYFGTDPAAPIVVGPGSRSAELRVMIPPWAADGE